MYEAFQASMDAKRFDGFKIADTFSTWELQRDHPVIHVTHDREQNHFRITQKRYLNGDSNNVDSGHWFIPLNFAHSGNPDFLDTNISHYFELATSEKTISTVDIPGFADDNWFVFNKQQLNFYRVNYDDKNWHSIVRTLNSESFNQIHVHNRAQLVDDALYFAFDGYIGFDIAFGILTYLEHETEYLPWAAASNYLDRLDYLLLEKRSLREKFYELINHLVSRMFANHGIEQQQDDKISTKQACEFAINWACRTGSVECLKQSLDQIRLMSVEQNAIPKPEEPLELAFICNGLKAANKSEEFKKIWIKLKNSTDQSERLKLIDSLACSSEPMNIRSFLEASIALNSDVNYRPHERSRIFNSILSSSSEGISETLEFLTKHFIEIQNS